MKVTSLHIACKYNLGGYEMLEVGASAELDFGESFDEGFRKLDSLLMAKKPAKEAKV
jgi:hypothetical protein